MNHRRIYHRALAGDVTAATISKKVSDLLSAEVSEENQDAK